MNDKNLAVLVPADELAELRRDAKRYRWLRDSSFDGPIYVCDERKKAFKNISHTRLDRAIDEVMKP